MNDWRIGHPVPRRYADAAGYLVDAVDGAALVVARNDEIVVDDVDTIGFPMTFYLLHVELFLLDELIDRLALTNRSDEDMWSGSKLSTLHSKL